MDDHICGVNEQVGAWRGRDESRAGRKLDVPLRLQDDAGYERCLKLLATTFVFMDGKYSIRSESQGSNILYE